MSVDLLEESAPSVPRTSHCRFSVGGSVRTTISKLFIAGGPAAIFGRVRAVIVDAVNGVLRRGGQAHVFDESTERAPTAINSNAPTAVVGIAWNIWVEAASTHAFPNSVLAKIASPVRHPPSHAPATCRTTVAKCGSGDNTLRPAFTPTQPCRRGSLFAALGYHCPFPKGLAHKVNFHIGAV